MIKIIKNRQTNTKNGKTVERVWLENHILTDNGISRGMLYNIEAGKIVFCNDGKKKVSGKLDKPIIDITGKNALLLTGNANSYSVTYINNTLVFEAV